MDVIFALRDRTGERPCVIYTQLSRGGNREGLMVVGCQLLRKEEGQVY